MFLLQLRMMCYSPQRTLCPPQTVFLRYQSQNIQRIEIRIVPISHPIRLPLLSTRTKSRGLLERYILHIALISRDEVSIHRGVAVVEHRPVMTITREGFSIDRSL